MSNWGNQDSKGGKAGRQIGANSSAGFWKGPDFDNLYLQKRSTDEESIKRRNSLADQYKSGFISRAWHKYMSGPAGPTAPTKPM
ncbi:hypothetical protein DL764_000284 [Monosporascus ibericus]|uniref:Uncharacterized protein n=1 Tax=Monosporascus ibericus TaxID=155417 RepID=A0A4Q4TU63_9PEZI|nr:hypothetical protein DL764_000284 [Monosporascus ibericus]